MQTTIFILLSALLLCGTMEAKPLPNDAIFGLSSKIYAPCRQNHGRRDDASTKTFNSLIPFENQCRNKCIAEPACKAYWYNESLKECKIYNSPVANDKLINIGHGTNKYCQFMQDYPKAPQKKKQ